MLKYDYSNVSTSIQSPSLIYFVLLNRAKVSKKSGVKLTESIIDALSDFLKNNEIPEEDINSMDSFLKNIKAYNIRFGLQTIGRKYTYTKKEIQYLGIINEDKNNFIKKYITGNYFGEISDEKKKDIALDNILSEVDFLHLNSSSIEDKMRICLENKKYKRKEYVEEVTSLFSNIAHPSKIERMLLKSFVWTFLR